MAIKNYDYKKIEISYKQLKISYFHKKRRYSRGCENNDKEKVGLFKVLDLLLSFLSSILSILKIVFV